MKTGVLFDLDGTLLNTIEDLKDSVNYALAQYDCPPRTLEDVRNFIGNGARRLIQLSLPGQENDPDVDEVLAVYQEHYKAHSQVKTCPYPGVVEALKKVAEKYPVAIVSNKPDAATKILCRHFFGDVFARGESTDCARKPAPDMLVNAMQSIGVDRCVYVGDSEVDVLTARNTGCKCLSVLWGFRDREVLEQAGGKHFCDDPAKLPEMLDALMD